jgi:hypothetical protein
MIEETIVTKGIGQRLLSAIIMLLPCGSIVPNLVSFLFGVCYRNVCKRKMETGALLANIALVAEKKNYLLHVAPSL